MRFGRARYKAEFDRLPEGARKRMIDWWGEPVAHGFARRDPNRRVDKKIASSIKPESIKAEPIKPGAGGVTTGEEPWSDRDTTICSRRWRSATRSSRCSRRAATA